MVRSGARMDKAPRRATQNTMRIGSFGLSTWLYMAKFVLHRNLVPSAK